LIPIFKKIIFLTLFLLFFIKCSKQEGCTDNNSINYSLDNKIDNGSCKYITGTWYGGLDIDGSSKTIEFNIDNSNQTSQSGTVKTSHHGQGTFNMVRGINGTSVADSLKNWNHIIINGLLDNNLNGNYNFHVSSNGDTLNFNPEFSKEWLYVHYSLSPSGNVIGPWDDGIWVRL
tara:strand:+ start:993 stop:1514 length:522 start_codon:yes stop_codon:yes gene_type:complete